MLKHIHSGGDLQQPTIAGEVKLQSIDVAGDPQGSVYSFIRGAAEKLHSDPVECESHTTKLSLLYLLTYFGLSLTGLSFKLCLVSVQLRPARTTL